MPLSNEPIVEQSGTERSAEIIVEPSGAAMPSTEPPRSLSDEPTVESSVELSSAKLSSDRAPSRASAQRAVERLANHCAFGRCAAEAPERKLDCAVDH